MNKIRVIDLLNKIANDELKENTKFYDKYDNKTYIYKPKSYNGIYREGKAYANENWYLTLNGSSRLLDEVEIIEDTQKEDKKIEKLDLSDWWEITSAEDCKPEKLAIIFNKNAKAFSSKINEIINKVNGR